VPESSIRNPNASALGIVREVDDDAKPKKTDPQLRVNRLSALPAFDAVMEGLLQNVQTKVVGINAKVLEGTGKNRRLVHYKNFREFARSKPVRDRILKHYSMQKLRDLNASLREEAKTDPRLKESGASDDFYTGLYPDEAAGNRRSVFPIHDSVLPALNSPYAKQQTLHDYLTAHVKCWDAATRNPLGKRIVNIVPQFVLSRGLTCDVPDPAHQKAWDEFWLRHDMTLRIKTWLRELMTYGEQFNRHFVVKGKLTQRQIDPCTIWDVVTNLEDLEDVKYYYQQYVASSPIIVPGEQVPASILVIRHIPAEEVDHFTLNKSSSEKRGRSELYAILGWLLRFREFMDDRIMQNKMRSMFALDVSVKGGKSEVDRANEQFATPPGPGAVAVHNDAIAIEYKNASTDASDAKTDADMLLKVIAIGAGISEQFLGVSSASTRASALLQTEPDVKNFETYQQVIEMMLHKTYRRLVDTEKLPVTKAIFEVSFPGLAAEDRTAKLKDLAMMEAQDWITKERSATMASREVGITGYDYGQEQEAIRQERGKDPLVMQGFQSVPKEAPEPIAGPGGATNSDARKVTKTSAEMGYSAKAVSGRGLANTRATLNRGGFTRGGERASITGQKSAGAPLKASAAVWGVEARARSLETRRRKKLARLMTEQAQTADGRDITRLGVEIARVQALLESSGPRPTE